MQILIAEDDYICRRVLLLFFQRLGYQAKCVENGLECLNEALKNSYDLIVTDIDMPEMTGIECTVELRRAGVDAFIVAVTASCSWPNPREYCLNAGMNEFLPKPFHATHLTNVLREAYSFKSEARRRQLNFQTR